MQILAGSLLVQHNWRVAMLKALAHKYQADIMIRLVHKGKVSETNVGLGSWQSRCSCIRARSADAAFLSLCSW